MVWVHEIYKFNIFTVLLSNNPYAEVNLVSKKDIHKTTTQNLIIFLLRIVSRDD